MQQMKKIKKVVNKLKGTNCIVNLDIDIMNEDSPYRSKLIGIVNAIDYFFVLILYKMSE